MDTYSGSKKLRTWIYSRTWFYELSAYRWNVLFTVQIQLRSWVALSFSYPLHGTLPWAKVYFSYATSNQFRSTWGNLTMNGILMRTWHGGLKASTGVFGGGGRLFFTKYINLVSLEQFHHNPMGMYTKGDHHRTFPRVCDGIAAMTYGLYVWWR